MRGLLVALVFIGLPLFIYCVAITVAHLSLRKRMRGLDEPELWLPKAERQDHARKLLRREDDQYIQQMISDNMRVINERYPS